MKKLIFILVITVISSVFVGCSRPDANNDTTIRSINVAKSNGFGPLNTNYIVKHEDKQSIKKLHNILNKASKEDGMVNMPDPDYEITVKYTNRKVEHFYLWLGEDERLSVLMNLRDSHTIYTIPSRFNLKLKTLVQLPS